MPVPNTSALQIIEWCAAHKTTQTGRAKPDGPDMPTRPHQQKTFAANQQRNAQSRGSSNH
jgi:hypothetical protein